jgi:ribulose kinase
MAATAAGAYPDALTSKRAMQSSIAKVYKPEVEMVGIYNTLYDRYLQRCKIEEDLKNDF